MLSRLRDKAKRLIERHGAEVSAVAKITANALIPGAPVIVSAVEAMCDYTADKSQELTDDRMMEMLDGLGADVGQLDSLLEHMAGQLDGAIAQMTQSLSASLALLLVTTLYNNDSHLFSILLNPSPPALVSGVSGTVHTPASKHIRYIPTVTSVFIISNEATTSLVKITPTFPTSKPLIPKASGTF